MTTLFPEIRIGEVILPETSDELIFRQIISAWIEDGLPSSLAFGYATSDNMMPSYSRSSVVSAQESRDWFDAHARNKSQAVFGVSVSEASTVTTRVIDDSGVENPQENVAPGHCFIDFRASERQLKTEIRSHLLMCALRRGEFPTKLPGSQISLFD